MNVTAYMDVLQRIRLAGMQQSDLPYPEEIMKWFELLGAGWVHNGNPAKPHAVLHAGDHSTGFFLCKKVLAYGNLREVLAACIIRKLRATNLEKVDGVFGSPYSSILLAGDVARLLGVKIYVPEKDPTDPEKKRMIFKPDDIIPEGAVLLQIEELVTTGKSCDAARDAIIAGNPYPVKFASYVGVLVHRPKEINCSLSDGRTIISVIERKVNAWKPDDCPLCKRGSLALFPKTQWAELTA